MATSYTGLRVQDTYNAIIKIGDNSNLTGTPKLLSDGLGNDSPLYLSGTRLGIGISPAYQFHTSGNAKIGGNLIVSGNLTVNGTLTYLNVEDLAVEDPIIKLAKDNTANTLDIGLFGKYVATGTKYKGFFNDASDDKFKLFIGTTVEPTTTVDTSASGYTVGTLVANLEGNVTGTVSSLSNHDTDNLSEGTTNLYFTTTRARASFTAGTGVTITDGEIAIGQDVATDSNVTFGNITGSAISGTTGTFSDDVSIAVSKKLKFGGGNHTYINEDIDDRLRFFVGGSEFMRFTEDTADTINFFKNAIFSGTISASNLSGTNTGDQTLPTDFVSKANGGTFGGDITIAKTDPTITLYDNSGSNTDPNGRILFKENAATDHFEIVYNGLSDRLEFNGRVGTSMTDLVRINRDTTTPLTVLGGGSFTGQLTIPETPTADAHAASKKYVDDNIVPAQSLSNVLGVGNTSGANDIIIADDQKIYFGSDSDLSIDYDSTGDFGRISNTSGHLYIQNKADDRDIIFRSDDGSGGVVEYFRLDGSTNTIPFGRSPHITDNVKLYFGNDTANDASIKWDSTASELFIDGESKFLDNLAVVGAIKDSDGDAGTSGQVLSSTGTGTNWIDLEADVAKRIDVTVKNVSGGSLAKGTVVHAAPTATPPSGNVIEVIAADANDAAKMPSIGVLNETIADQAEGEAVMFGAVSGIDTSSFTIGDELYVSETAGEFTATKPTAYTSQVQKIAVVIKSHASNGLIKVFGAGRANDVPNRIDRNVNFTDSSLLSFGNGVDFYQYHDGTNSYIKNYTGDLSIEQNANDKDIIFKSDDGSGGTVEYFRLDGSLATHDGTNTTETVTVFPDNSKIQLGAGANGDLRLFHNGTNSVIANNTGNIQIINYSDDKDIIFKSDNGSGGTVEYFRVDGSTNTVPFGRSPHIVDNLKLYFGNDTANDASIRWDSTASQLFIDGNSKFLDDLYVVGTLFTSEFIRHTGDTGTHIQMLSDQMILRNTSGMYINIHPNNNIYYNAVEHVFYNGITSQGHIVPSIDSTYDLGATSLYWRNIYADNIISNGGDAEFQKVYKDTVTINESTYTTVATVSGNNLASAVRLNVSGVGSSSVINVDAKILVNHYQDILIKSTCAYYRKLYIKVVSDSNEDFAIELKKDTGGATSQSVNIEITPLNSEEITITNSHSISGTTHEHLTEYGESQSSEDTVGGNGYHYWLKDDGAQLKIGAGQDLRLFHDGTNNVVKSYTGDLYIQAANSVRLTNVGASEHYAKFFENGAVELMYDNSKKFETTSAGVSVTGDITLDDDLNFSTNGFADISNTGTGAMRFKPSSQTLALTLTGANATFAGNATISENIFVGESNSTDNYVKIFHTDDAYTEIHGYGIVTDRTSYYLRPVYDGTQNLYIGGFDAALDWNSIQLKFNTDVDFVQNGTNRLTINSSGIDVAGEVTINEDLYATNNNLKLHAGGTHVLNIDVLRHVYPNTHNSTDLGFSTSLAFRDLYLSGNAYLGGGMVALYSETTQGIYDDNNGIRILNPGGGSNNSLGNSGTTGAIKITLPVSWTNTMMRMTIKVYDYSANDSFTLVCGGYNYAPSSAWINEFAYIESAGNVDVNYTIRMGHDGSKCCIYIGELTTVWSYPKVYVTEVELGFSGLNASNWRTGWSISMETSAFGTITHTELNPQVNNWVRNGSSLYYGQSGNIAIGTTATSAVDTNNGTPKLQVEVPSSAGNHPLAARFTCSSDAGDNSGVSVLVNSGNDRGLMISAGRASGNVARATLNIVTNTGDELTDGITLQQLNSGGSTSRIGIGTDSPGAKLEIFGTGNSLRLDSAANQSKTILFRNVGSGTAEIKTDGDLKLNAEDSGKTIQFFTENTERARLDSSGRLGINTTTPADKLDVYNGSYSVLIGSASFSWTGNSIYPTIYGSNQDRWVMITSPHIPYLENGVSGYTGNTAGARVRFASQSGGSAVAWDAGVPHYGGTDTFTIGRSNTALVQVNSIGNVGIGGAPSHKLHIKQNSAANLINLIEQDNASYEAWYEAKSQNSGYVRFGISNNANAYAFFNTSVTSYNWYHTGGGLLMTLNSNGHLGLGITNLTFAKLAVNGATYSSGGTFNAGISTVTDAAFVLDEEDWIYTRDSSQYARKLIGKSSNIITIGQSGTNLIDEIHFLSGSDGANYKWYRNTSVAMQLTGSGSQPYEILDVKGRIKAETDNGSAVNVPRSKSIPYQGSSGYYDFDPVAEFGQSKSGGYVLLEVNGWQTRFNAGYIHWNNNGSGTGVIGTGSVVYRQIAWSGSSSGAGVTVSLPSSSTNIIRISFSGWHGNNHGWTANIINRW